ncbi:MAG: YegS/Rv2252/BmrU family lipid kinase [Daejeonella sp.]
MKKSILFVINPISGGKNKNNFRVLADQYLDKNVFEAKYVFTEQNGHAHQIALDAIENNTDIVVAVGGDGTVNEIASALEGSGKIMGIIPYGSGNGLARSLGIPLKTKQAISRLNELKTDNIDCGVINNYKFFSTAGVGFDAHISSCFAQNKTRGFRGYVKTIFAEIGKYKAQNYQIEIDGSVYKRRAFMVSIANSSQFGNNAHIAPFASVKDGLLDVCIIKPFPLYLSPVMIYHMFNKSTHKSKYVEIIQGKKIRIIREKEDMIHLDGEPLLLDPVLEVMIKPLSLTIIK